VGVQELERRRAIATCERAGESIAEVWNETARQKLRAALVGSGVSYAEVTADKVMPWLDDHAQAWKAIRTDVCLGTEVHGTWDEDLHARAQWCLDERRMELEALVEELSRGTSQSVENAAQAAAGLEQVDPCGGRDHLLRTPNPPAERREEVRVVRTELSRAAALERTGSYEDGFEVARKALSRAEAIEWPPLTAAARLRLGDFLIRAAEYAEAEEMLETAYFEAAKAGAVEVETRVANALVVVVGHQLARHAEGLRWSRLAELGLASLPDPAGAHTAGHLANAAVVHRAMGSYDEAKTLLERALTIQERALGPEHPDLTRSMNELANVYEDLGEFEGAKALHERALALRERALGSEHPEVATGLHDLAGAHDEMGSYEEAKALYERALTIRERVLGAEHPDFAATLNNLAIIHAKTGSYEEARRLFARGLLIDEKARGPEHPAVAMSVHNLASINADMGSYEEAKALHERALAIREKTLGPDHRDVAMSLGGLALLHRWMGSNEEAKALFERALLIQEKALGPEHPHVAMILNNLAHAHEAMASYEEATDLLERALAIREAALGPEHPEVGDSLVALARVALAQGRAADAVALAERGVRVRENAAVPAAKLSCARFILARAIWDAGGDRSRALALAESAHEGCSEVQGDLHGIDAVESWLAQRRHAK
jgi:eukaryotic-like serine/threonine-protein kinase